MSQAAANLSPGESVVGRFLEGSDRFFIEPYNGLSHAVMVLDALNEYDDLFFTSPSRPDREILFGAECFVRAKVKFSDIGRECGKDDLRRDLAKLLRIDER